MNRTEVESPENAYRLLFQAATLIPISHYAIGVIMALIVFLYNFLEFHLLEDLLTLFRGSPVSLTYHSCSEIYQGVASKCRILHGRYLATPWLSSPHIQIAFLHFFGRPPAVTYRRQIFHASDGGTFALDWVLNTDVMENGIRKTSSISKDDTTPIVVVIPGLTSDSDSTLMQLVFKQQEACTRARRGWNVVVSNHRGLGGISVTTDCFYNAGWTKDVREVINHLHHEYPKAPLFAVGTSIGANVLVKYLGEDGENVPVAGAVAICSPWDLLIGDRFISRKLIQKLYDRALTIGLQDYAKQHQPRYTRLADWDGIAKSRSIRDFDNYATCLVGKFETADTYYRRCSSSSYVGNVSVPLLCISSLDDPVCTREAIPWDECRANTNIVLATTRHGGHLAFFQGWTASGVWWVRASLEFLNVLHCSPFMHKQKKIQDPGPHSSIDQGPYVNVTDGMVAAMADEPVTTDVVIDSSEWRNPNEKARNEDSKESEQVMNPNPPRPSTSHQNSEQASGVKEVDSPDTASQITQNSNQISRQNKTSMWLLSYIAVLSTWPLVGAAFYFFFKKKPTSGFAAKLRRT